MDWKDTADWSGLPDVYVTKAQISDGMFWRVDACSVPMVIGPEVRLITADKHARIVAEKDARIAELEARLNPSNILVCECGMTGPCMWDGCKSPAFRAALKGDDNG